MDKKKTVFSTPWFSVESLVYPEHGITVGDPYYRLVEADGVVIVALTPDERIVLVRQFRPALGEYTLELPAGGTDAGESPADSARRELYEETGYRAEEMVALSSGMPLLASRSTMKGFAFLAKGAMKDHLFTPPEHTEAVEVSLADLRTMAAEGSFTQFSGLGAILLWLWKTDSTP